MTRDLTGVMSRDMMQRQQKKKESPVNLMTICLWASKVKVNVVGRIFQKTCVLFIPNNFSLNHKRSLSEMLTNDQLLLNVLNDTEMKETQSIFRKLHKPYLLLS